MNSQQRLDKVLEAVRENVQEEVGALMGVDFSLSDFFKQLCSKEDYFAEIMGKKIIAKVDVTGEIEGKGALVIDLKDGIRLGGTLIMLPQSELEEVIKSEDYSEETEDSYGEIANIVSGAYTKVFEDMFPKSCRFIRKEQKLVAPLKVEIESDEPFVDQWYYMVRAEMAMDGVQMGEMDFLLPAEPFGLEIPGQQKPESTEAQGKSAGEIEPSSSPELKKDPESDVETNQVGGEDDNDAPQKLTAADTEKRKKLLDKLLEQCRLTVGDEVGALLGVDVKLGPSDNKIVDKEQYFFEEASGKQILSHIDINDDLTGKAYLFVGLKDAIRIGSILIMLPPSELEVAVSEEDFSADVEDAFGEIANIMAGSYTSIFQEHYVKSIRFIKKELETVNPMKVDTESNEIIPSQHYYLNTCKLEIDGKECGNIAMLLPVDLFELGQLIAEKEVKEAADSSQQADKGGESAAQETDISSGSGEGDGQPTPQQGSTVVGAVSVDYDTLVIENNRVEADKIIAELNKAGISTKAISYNDSIRNYISGRLKLIVIVMNEVDEQSYGVTIQVNTLCDVPIVAAGAEWTRSKVIKAVKYGVNDILLTPANSDDIREKIENNMLKLAA